MERESARIREETERALRTASSPGNAKKTRASSASPYRSSSGPYVSSAAAATAGTQYVSALSALQAIQVMLFVDVLVCGFESFRICFWYV